MTQRPFFRSLRWLVAFALLTLVAACATLRPDPPEVSISGVRLLELGFAEQKFGLQLRVRNPNSREFVINRLDYQLDVGGNPFIRGQTKAAITLPANGEVQIEVPANMRLREFLNSAVGQLFAGKGGADQTELDYRLYGNARLDDMWTTPFERKGKLDPQGVGDRSRR